MVLADQHLWNYKKNCEYKNINIPTNIKRRINLKFHVIVECRSNIDNIK